MAKALSRSHNQKLQSDIEKGIELGFIMMYLCLRSPRAQKVQIRSLQ